MDIFQFSWSVLAWTVTVAVLWPLNVPMAVLSFRIWRETKEADVEASELWIRAALASGSIAILIVLFVAVDYMLADLAELPAGPVHMVILIGFLALACWVMLYMFGLEDFFQGLSMAVIYLFLPMIALFLVNGLLGLIDPSLRFWDWPVRWAAAWLKQPPVSIE